MDTVLQGIDKTICYVDDILVTGSTAEEHLQNLESVLERLQKYGIRAKRAKCLFMSEKVEYLGHRIDSEGLHTMASKVEAIKHGTPPQKHTGTQVLLGFTPLLWQISTWPSHSVASFESPAQSWTEVDLDKEVHGRICGCKETPSDSPRIGPLRSLIARENGRRCLSLRHRGSDFPCVPGWERTAHHIRISNFDHR